jgi:2-dehydro-3-deoxyphosphogluconate aldolase/(4S)-4-hydroxy-2-oxoglutarate aldolase
MSASRATLAEAVRDVPVVAVLRGLATERAAELAAAAVSGGLRAIEITMDSPGAPEAIRRVATTAPSEVAVGAGTVVTRGDLEAAIAAGASFAVAPHLDLEILEAGRAAGLLMVPGVATPTELHTAVGAGAGFVKLFPAAPMGFGYVSALRGPYPEVPLMVSGGITVEQVVGWLDAGASAVGIGQSGLAAEPSAMRRRAAEVVRAVDQSRRRSA